MIILLQREYYLLILIQNVYSDIIVAAIEFRILFKSKVLLL